MHAITLSAAFAPDKVVHSVWKSPTKQWSENKGPERLESTSTDSSGPRSADREGDRSRLKHIFAAVQFPSQTGKVVQKDSPRMATANDALESERQRLPGSSHEEGESHGMENAARGGEGARAALEVPVWNATRQQEPHSDLRHEALQEAVQRQQRLYDEQMSRDSAVSDFEPSPSESTRPVSTLSSGRGSGGYTRAPTDMQLAYSQRSEQSVRDPEIQSQYRAHHEASPSPLEISQVPRALNQELAGTQETMAGDADSLVEVAALGLVICNKTISVISPVNGASPGARSPGGTIYGMRRAVTVGLVQVHGILPNSSASRCDGLGVGDEILAVNSLSCRGRSCREVVSYLTPISTNLAGQVQYIKPVHIISRRCSGMRGLRPRETLCHSSIVAGGEQFSRHPNSSPDWLPVMRPNQRTSMNDLPNTGLSASMGAVEEALFQKMRDKPTARSLVPGERKSLYDTTWRTFPLISLSVSPFCMQCGQRICKGVGSSEVLANMKTLTRSLAGGHVESS